MCCFCLAALMVLSLILISAMLACPVWICLGSYLFKIPLYPGLKCVSFPRLGDFRLLILQINFLPLSSFSPSRTPIIQTLVYLMFFQRSLKLSSLFKISFSFFCSTFLISTTLSSSAQIYSSASSNLLLIYSSVFFSQLLHSSDLFGSSVVF